MCSFRGNSNAFFSGCHCVAVTGYCIAVVMHDFNCAQASARQSCVDVQHSLLWPRQPQWKSTVGTHALDFAQG